MTQKVLTLSPLSGELVKLLIQQTAGVPDFEVVFGHEMTHDEIKQQIADADIVMGDYTFKQKITAEHAAAAKKLKLIEQPSVGYQHIDVKACTAAGIKVANTAGANTVSVAEHTVAWGLCLLKNMFFAHTTTRAGGWEQMNVKCAEIQGKVWGIIGFGNIGKNVAARLKPFNLAKILYYDLYRPTGAVEKEYGVEYAEISAILSQSDIISLHAPLTDSTRNMINKETINTMKPNAYIINVARAELVDEQALADAIASGRIMGAGVDVFTTEPVAADNPLLAVEGKRLLLSPHVAGVTDEAAGRIINMASANIARVLKGEKPESLVN